MKSQTKHKKHCAIFIKTVKQLFPLKKFIIVLDEAFATVKYLKWALENNVSTEVRMHINKVVSIMEPIQLRKTKGFATERPEDGPNYFSYLASLSLMLFAFEELINMTMKFLFIRLQLQSFFCETFKGL